MLENLGWILFSISMAIAGFKVIAWSATFPAELPENKPKQTAEVVPMRRRTAQQEPRRAA